MASDDEEVLTDEQVRSALGLRSGHKKVLALVGDSMYKREGDGNWYRLSRAPDQAE